MAGHRTGKPVDTGGLPAERLREMRLLAALPDPAKLEIMAEWLDRVDDKLHEYGVPTGPEMQRDIRAWAREIREIRNSLDQDIVEIGRALVAMHAVANAAKQYLDGPSEATLRGLREAVDGFEAFMHESAAPGATGAGRRRGGGGDGER